ncbi:copper amine oxidase N-terminal domain-containing protein [Paenibacillus albidus]|uniref:copper amine oxidase N-terminal domain-containing protein n=1 Tax=Paenibacillus albidus TaxID=2041023 RepID=UPI001BEA3C1F|nr:copper amine oxidase N-terminal domain-containing protein [Paenibacillus albidus]MBT2291465.1 copper amine oxidase N-terminal domain-containing protein [Paenibacillus albidus]
MKLLKLGLAVTLASTLLFGFSYHSFAASTAIKSPVLLQINEYHILYTYPKQPYIDNKQRLIVPLRAVSELLGASVSYNAELKQAIIEKNGKEIILTGNSNKIIVDGVVKTIDTVPVVYKQSFMLPIRVLLDNMNLKATHVSQTGVLHVDDDAINNFNMLKDIKEWDIPSDRIANQNGILTTTFDLTLSEISENQLQQGSINLTAKNISGNSIPNGKEDLHVMFLFNNTYQMEADLNTTSEQRPRPALTKGQVFQQKTEFAAGNYGDYLKYILAVGRILK